MHPCLILFFVATALNILRIIVEMAFVDPRKLQSYNRLIGEWRRRMREAIKSRNPRLMEKVRRDKAKVDNLMLEINKMRMKSMMILMAISMPVFFIFVWPYRYEKFYVPFLLRYLSGVWYFALLSIATSALLSIILKYKGYM